MGCGCSPATAFPGAGLETDCEGRSSIGILVLDRLGPPRGGGVASPQNCLLVFGGPVGLRSHRGFGHGPDQEQPARRHPQSTLRPGGRPLPGGLPSAMKKGGLILLLGLFLGTAGFSSFYILGT